VPAKVHSCYVGQVNCGPAHDTDGRADDAAALTDEAHAIRVDGDASLKGRRSLSSAGQQPVRGALGDPARRRRCGGGARRDGAPQQARPMDNWPQTLGHAVARRREPPNSTLSNGAGSRWTVTMHFNSS
jgi:hypothetical protein